MPIAILDTHGQFVKVLCHESEADDVKNTLQASGFTTGPIRAAEGLGDNNRIIHISLSGSWNEAATNRLREVYPDARISES